MNLQASNQEIDVRVSTIPTVNGESISLRLLSRGGQQFGFDRLDMSKKQERRFGICWRAERNHFAYRPDRLRKIDIVVLLFKHDQFGIAPHHHDRGAGRIQIARCFADGRETGDRFHVRARPAPYPAAGPNVVMVGEIRDVETADIAIRAAMTGHLVFSTLHTNDAVGGITRLLDMDVEPFLLAVSCKVVHRATTGAHDLSGVRRESRISGRVFGGDRVPAKRARHRIHAGKGCEQCRHTAIKAALPFTKFAS